MQFHRFYHAPLAQAAYLIAADGEAVVVDPRRDVDDILAHAQQLGVRIRWVLATHVHADFVAGLGEIAAATGAPIALGERFDGPLPAARLGDGQELQVGGIRITAMATPGHTPESTCFLVQPPTGIAAPERLLSGDTLFLGDVGRPDLVAAAGHEPRAMARALHASLHQRIAPLPDATEIWPAHGAGSACGTSISCEASSTLGLQRIGNWALAETDAERFCDRLLGALRPPPAYFAHVAALNRRGAPLLAGLEPLRALTASAAADATADGAAVLDVRSKARYAQGHWPSALNLAVDGNDFESWAGALLPPPQRLLLHAETPDQALLARRRLLRIGCDDVAGFTLALPAATVKSRLLDAAGLFLDLQRGERWQLLDVRRRAEFAAGHVAGALHAELTPDLGAAPGLAALDRQRPTAVICRSGYRASAALQQLEALGFTALGNVQDGMLGWQQNHLPVERSE